MTPLLTSRRFWDKVAKSKGCWEWTGCLHPEGYGQFKLDGSAQPAHRIAYQLIKGDIPEGLVIDHVCRNRSCVNPDHLDAVTQGENVRRVPEELRYRPKANNDRLACRNGHTFTEENTRWLPSGRKTCKSCKNESNKKYRSRNK